MTVKVILSYILSRAPAKSAWNRQAISYIARTKAQKELDNKPEMYVIIFTGHLANDSATPTRQTKTPVASPPRHPQPTSRSRQPSSVSQQRLLRLRRPDAGQVRDAAPGSHRQGFHQRVRAGLRFLPPIVLSGAGRAAAGRRVRLASGT